ncbi:MAG TPA: winged helix-turn-helix domain-containing protein [Caulobacteraceae bacterium]
MPFDAIAGVRPRQGQVVSDLGLLRGQGSPSPGAGFGFRAMRGYDSSPMPQAVEPTAASAPIRLAREPHFRLGALLIKPSLLEVSTGPRRRMLEPRVMQVLVALARMDGQVVTRDELIEACWAGRIVGEDAINRCIGRLRRLAETFEGGFSIETVPRVGYRLNAAAAGEPATLPRPPAFARSLRAAFAFAAAALAIGVGAALTAR